MPSEPLGERSGQLIVARASRPEVGREPLAGPRRDPLTVPSGVSSTRPRSKRLDSLLDLCQFEAARGDSDGVPIPLVQVWAKDIQHEAIPLGKIEGTAIELHRRNPAGATRQALGDTVLGTIFRRYSLYSPSR
jgi:hypothetical protein